MKNIFHYLGFLLFCEIFLLLNFLLTLLCFCLFAFFCETICHPFSFYSDILCVISNLSLNKAKGMYLFPFICTF